MNKPIKQSVINSFNRVGIPYEQYTQEGVEDVTVHNQFGYGSAKTSRLVAECIVWVYGTSRAYERGDYSVKISDFDRIRYFVLAQDSKAYMACLD